MIEQRTAPQHTRSALPWPTTWQVTERLPTRSELRAEIRANRPLRRLTTRLLGRRVSRSAGATGEGPSQVGAGAGLPGDRPFADQLGRPLAAPCSAK
jgi:hypothetical protein